MISLTAIVVLAAGSSSRMGQSKQLLEVNGEKLLLQAVHTALAVNDAKVFVVLAPNASAHYDLIKSLPVEIVMNSQPEKGMGSSIKIGIERVLDEPQVTKAILMVCDQPLLTARHLEVLISRQSTSGKTIIASRYGQQNGIPVLFCRDHFQELLEIDDNVGARSVIEKNKSRVATEPFPGGEFDLDTIDDVIRIRKQMNWR